MRPKGPNPVDVLVGSRIRLLRKRRKMSQAELGKALGVTFQQVQKYENGKNRVGASRLHLVATALDVPVSEFFAGAAETTRTSFATKSVAFDPQAFRIAEVRGHCEWWDPRFQEEIVERAGFVESVALHKDAWLRISEFHLERYSLLGLRDLAPRARFVPQPSFVAGKNDDFAVSLVPAVNGK